MSRKIQACLSELIGTFVLVFVGCTCMVLGSNPEVQLPEILVALSFGVSVWGMIMLLGLTSGAHINPAVSLTFYLRKEISAKKYLVYTIMQLSGAVLAVFLMSALPFHHDFGTTLPHIGAVNSWLLEFFMTFIMLAAIFKFRHLGRNKLALIIGSIVFLEAYLGGSSTGASMNPARSFGPMWFNGNLDLFWIYLTSQAIAANLVYFLFRRKN